MNLFVDVTEGELMQFVSWARNEAELREEIANWEQPPAQTFSLAHMPLREGIIARSILVSNPGDGTTHRERCGVRKDWHDKWVGATISVEFSGGLRDGEVNRYPCVDGKVVPMVRIKHLGTDEVYEDTGRRTNEGHRLFLVSKRTVE